MFQYTRNQLISLCYWWKLCPAIDIGSTSAFATELCKPLSADTWNTLKQLKILKPFRGKRGQSTTNLSSIPSKTNLLSKSSKTSEKYRIIDVEFNRNIAVNSSFINIQLRRFPYHNNIISTDDCIFHPEDAGLSAGHKDTHIINQLRARNLDNLVVIKPNAQSVPPRKCLNFGNVNARSLRNKSEVFIDHIISNNIDVCIVTETWVKDDDNVSLAALSPHGYSFKHCPRVSRSGGGTGIIYRNSFKVELIKGNHNISFESSEWNLSAHGRVTKLIAI